MCRGRFVVLDFVIPLTVVLERFGANEKWHEIVAFPCSAPFSPHTSPQRWTFRVDPAARQSSGCFVWESSTRNLFGGERALQMVCQERHGAFFCCMLCRSCCPRIWQPRTAVVQRWVVAPLSEHTKSCLETGQCPTIPVWQGRQLGPPVSASSPAPILVETTRRCSSQ